MDFRNLVLEALVGKNSLVNWYKDAGSFPSVRQKLKSSFGIDFPDNVDPFFSALKDAYTRTTAEKLLGYTDVYPLVDFLFYIAEQKGSSTSGSGTEVFDNKPTLEEQDIKKYDADYSKLMDKKITGGNPFFNFTPISGKASILHITLAKHLSQNYIGQLSLANFDNLGIKQAIYGILAGHKKLRSSVLKNKNIPSAVKYIDSVLVNPRQYAGGKTNIPREFKEIYDNVSINELISISTVAQNLFQSELTRFKITNPITTFYQFITNEPLDDKKIFNFYWTARGLTQPTARPAESAPGKGDPGQGGYTIANIKKLNTPQSKELIQKLEAMANFVRSGELKSKKDITGALNSAAGVMRSLASAGGPTMR